MAAIFMYEVEDGDDNVVTRVRVLSTTEDGVNELEVETNTYSESSRAVLTAKQAAEFARDLLAAVKVARSK